MIPFLKRTTHMKSMIMRVRAAQRAGRQSVFHLCRLFMGALCVLAATSVGRTDPCVYQVTVNVHNVGTANTATVGVVIPTNGCYGGNGFNINEILTPGQTYSDTLTYFDTQWSCASPGSQAYAEWQTNSGGTVFNSSPQGLTPPGLCPPAGVTFYTQTLDFYITPGGGSGDPGDGDAPPAPPACIACSGCIGMPIWNVSEPYVNLWLRDEPLGYQPAQGPRVSLELAFKQREYDSGFNPNFFSFGKKWNCSWLSYIAQDGNSNNVVYFSGGRQSTFVTTNDYLTHACLSGSATNGFTLVYPDGSQDVYGIIITNAAGGFVQALLSQRQNAQGKGLLFNYAAYDPNDPVVLLQNIVDADNKTNFIYYTNNSFSSCLISRVVDAFGRTVSFGYDGGGHLTSITDVANLTTALLYDGNDYVTNMTTPYGTTTFNYTELVPGSSSLNGRSVLVTEPDGGKQLFLYTNNAPGVPASYSSGMVPSTSPFTNTLDNSEMNLRNTFYWGPRQYAALFTTNVALLTSNDFAKARLQHWLSTTGNSVGETLSMRSDFSLDASGSVAGQKRWYDYAGKTNTEYEGSQSLPLFTAELLPDGTSLFARDDRNLLGKTLTNTTTYSAAGGIALRTNIFVYDVGSGVDLIQATNALGAQIASNSYNGHHQLLTNYDALNQMTIFTYDTNQLVIGITRPGGLILTNIYNSNGLLAANFSYSVAGGVTTYFGTNSYTYSNDLVLTHTDARGLVTTSTWDNLQRLVRMDYPDGTFVSNSYNKLDLAVVTDRMSFTNAFGYDSMRRKIAETNALGNHTLYNYCTCGSLDSMQDALGNTTSYYYNNAGWRTNIIYPDFTAVANYYDLLGRLTNTTDSAGHSVTNWFNNQGLVYAISNYFGRVRSVTFDILDRVVTNVDANGVTIGKSYDNLNRLLTNSYPDTGLETFGYSANGLTAYTNQLGMASYYGYDAASHKTTETNANHEITRYSYSPAGDLLTFTDGNTQTTTWTYDIYGLVSNKLDATTTLILAYHYDPDNRLTNRYSAAKGNTYYSSDRVGNLTNITYPVSPAISIAYDALNRPTNMADVVGNSAYSYDAVGQLLSEDGPWANDSVNYGYTARMRTSLSLQQPNNSPWNQTYNYDGARRLTGTISPAGAFGYTYDSTAHTQVGNLSLPNAAYIADAYDSEARLTSTILKNSGNTNLDAYNYTYNVGNQRIEQIFTAGNYENYAYDNIGQVIKAAGTESNAITTRLQEQFGYGYDAAHNLNLRTNNALVENFAVNSLNQLSNVTHGGTLTVVGTTSSMATSVTVNSIAANRYNDATFAEGGFTVTNGNNSFTAIAADSLGRSSTNTISVNLSATASYSYDLNGNLLSDGNRYFAYDDENQLINVWVTNTWMSQFVYDGKMRRRIRKEYTWQSSSWVETNEVRYVYDGNLVIQERDINNLPTVAYTRGPDLSGSLQGAGGIGGLLAFSQLSAINPQHYYYHCDGNGNITALINGLQFIAAKYLYDPFGNLLSLSGPMAAANPYRFSSKENYANSGLAYYLYRLYDPNLQRWLNRDPLGEPGFENCLGHWSAPDAGVSRLPGEFIEGGNLYSFVRNQPINRFDSYGLVAFLDPIPGGGAVCAAILAQMSALNEVIEAAQDANVPPDATTLSAFAALQGLYAALCLKPRPPGPISCPRFFFRRTLNQDNQTFCQRHPNICLGGEIVAGTGIVVGAGILIIGTGGAGAVIIAF